MINVFLRPLQAGAVALAISVMSLTNATQAQVQQPYGEPAAGSYRPKVDDAYRPPAPAGRYDDPRDDRYSDRYAVPAQPAPPPRYEPDQGAARPGSSPPGTYGEPYRPSYGGAPRGASYAPPPPRGPVYYDEDPRDGTYSMREIQAAGHGFFGSLSKGLASVIEHAFRKQGRPNGYILGEDLGGAIVAGLRYGQGTLYTRDAGSHRVFWQGPSIGYDAGAEGSKVMVLIYNLREPDDIYRRFAGVAGSAYVVGGVGLTFQSHGDIVLAPIRTGIGLRLGANIGYLKYTRRPTWNPF